LTSGGTAVVKGDVTELDFVVTANVDQAQQNRSAQVRFSVENLISFDSNNQLTTSADPSRGKLIQLSSKGEVIKADQTYNIDALSQFAFKVKISPGVHDLGLARITIDDVCNAGGLKTSLLIPIGYRRISLNEGNLTNLTLSWPLDNNSMSATLIS